MSMGRCPCDPLLTLSLLNTPFLRMAKAREDLVKEKHELKEDLGVVEMRLEAADESNKQVRDAILSLPKFS